ncbi:MAG: DUF4869 domain-containing protein [Eubacterium sp.]|nr:DUF4869 domain-containing protein [Eubacterium sp.]
MISVFFGLDEDALIDPNIAFKHVYQDEWFEDDFVKEMILDIDHSQVMSAQCILSPVFGTMPVSQLSGGVKTLIMLYKLDDFVVDLIVCGENCCKWLSKIAQMKDIRVTLSGCDLEFEDCEISGICENDGSVIRNRADWVCKMCLLAGEAER